jgi:hypothetical protein
VIAQLTARCDPGGSADIGSDGSGIRSYEQVRASPGRAATTRFDVFPGGCLTTRVVAPPEQVAEIAGEVPLVLGFRSRQGLDRALSQRSDGRLRLTPTEPR